MKTAKRQFYPILSTILVLVRKKHFNKKVLVKFISFIEHTNLCTCIEDLKLKLFCRNIRAIQSSTHRSFLTAVNYVGKIF